MSSQTPQDQGPRQWPTLPTFPTGGLRTPAGSSAAPPPSGAPTPGPYGATATGPYGATSAGPYGQPAQPYGQPAQPYGQPAPGPYPPTAYADPVADPSTQWRQPPTQEVDVYNPPPVGPAPVSPSTEQREKRRRLAGRLSALTWPLVIFFVIATGDWWWILVGVFVIPMIVNWLRNS